MNKIKVLVLPSDKTGVGKFRSIDPHVRGENPYLKEFKLGNYNILLHSTMHCCHNTLYLFEYYLKGSSK
jgi:hypothetical protein